MSKNNHRNIHLRWVKHILLITICWFMASMAYAQSDGSASKLIEYLVQQKTNLTIAINNIKSFVPPQNLEDYQEEYNNNQAALAFIRGDIHSLESFFDNERKQQQILQQQLKLLQQSPSSNGQNTIILEKMAKITNLANVHKKTVELITENLALAERYEQSLLSKKQQLELWQDQYVIKRQIEKYNAAIAKFDSDINALYEDNIKLQQYTATDINQEEHIPIEAKQLLNNQTIILLQNRILQHELSKKIILADYQLQRQDTLIQTKSSMNAYQEAIAQLTAMQNHLRDVAELLQNQQLLLHDEKLIFEYQELQEKVLAQLKKVQEKQDKLTYQLEEKQKVLKKQLASRQKLVAYHLDTWPVILKELIQLPGDFYHYFKILFYKVADHYVWQDTLPIMFYWLCIGLIVILGGVLNRALNILAQDKQRSRLSAQLYDGLVALLQRNIPHLIALAALMTTFFLHGVSYPNYRLLLNLFLVWLAFRNFILIARLALLERLSDESGKDVTLYYSLKRLLLAGGWSTAFMVVSHQLPLSPLLQDIFNRLFMVFILALSIVLWKSQDAIHHIIHPFIKTKKRYVSHALDVVIILLPLTLFTTAVIGIIGYINMAWKMSEYQAYVILIITAYLLIRGIFLDFMELVSEWMISTLKNGWLWIEVLLKPLDKIIRIAIFILSVFLLFELFGWFEDILFMTHMKQIANYPFINLSGIRITLSSTTEFIILLSFLIWASKWTRECCYRWIFRNAKDAGIRNSLSVFTQYAVILVGSFITLRVLGVDFSGMSMILGGLAVGMGFGLRDFASNIIGGIMLLIERPVREGDLITLGDYEGRVAHIGIRSMRVSSWDNMEVLIPNAETFNKPFTNWTHQDNIVRTVIPVKVDRGDDPFMVQQLILDVLAIIPEILADPPAQVYLKQIDDALIEFEIRYFINIQEHTLFEIRSTVLFAITAQFKAAGIKAPIPPISVALKDDVPSNAMKQINEHA